MDFPLSKPEVGLVNGRFSDGSADGSVLPSLDTAAWSNAVTDEICNVIRAAGLVPDELDVTQLSVAIATLIASAIAGVAVPDLTGYARLATAQSWTAGQASVPVAINDAAPAINLAAGNVFFWVQGGNRTMPAPSGVSPGQSGVIWLSPNSHTMAYNTFWKFAGGFVPASSSSAGAMDALVYEVNAAGTAAACALIKGIA